MKQIPLTKKVLILCIVLNVVIFVVYGFLYYDIGSQNKKASVLLGQVNSDMQKNDTLRAIKVSLNQNKDFISQIDSFFIAPDGVVNFISLLESLGKKAGVKLSIGSVSVVPEGGAKDFKENLSLRLDMSGSWENIYYFLSLLQNQPYRIMFDNASVSLEGAADAIKFTDKGTARVRGQNEVWKGAFSIRVLKLIQQNP